VSREDGEERHEREWIVQIAESVDEFRIAFADEMVETHGRFVLGEVLNFADITFGLGLLVLLDMYLLSPDTVDDGIHGHEVDVLEVVVGLGCSLEFFGGFSGVDALEDAEFAEVLERELELPDGLGAADVLDDLAPFAGFNLTHYDC
jgi:hypothetical protein